MSGGDSKNRVYIAGPMTGMKDNNYPTFRMVARALSIQGYQVEDPSWYYLGSEDVPWEVYMGHGLARIQKYCNAMCFLPGWQFSRGAKVEAQFGLDTGLVFGYYQMTAKRMVGMTGREVEEYLWMSSTPAADMSTPPGC